MVFNLCFFTGGLATVGCLVGGLKNVLARDSGRQQTFMRGRVLAQGFTFGAIALGVVFAFKEKLSKQQKNAVTTREAPPPPKEAASQ